MSKHNIKDCVGTLWSQEMGTITRLISYREGLVLKKEEEEGCSGCSGCSGRRVLVFLLDRHLILTCIQEAATHMDTRGLETRYQTPLT